MAELNTMSWQDMVDNVILPKLAGGSNRCHISDDFMIFMAKFGRECQREDWQHNTRLTPILYTIAMQRLSKGALLHKTVDFRTQLPKKYMEYSSMHDNFGIMTEGCLEFIYNGLKHAAMINETNRYAVIQCFGIMKYLDANGKVQGEFSLACPNPEENGAKMYAIAEKIVEKSADTITIYQQYATPDQWQKHKRWLKEKLPFFSETDFLFRVYDGKGRNWFQRRKDRRNIMKEIAAT